MEGIASHDVPYLWIQVNQVPQESQGEGNGNPSETNPYGKSKGPRVLSDSMSPIVCPGVCLEARGLHLTPHS